MRLEDLKPNPGSRHKAKRVGRGIGSGHGKTATKGHKGQSARNTIRPGFEGGQTPLHRRLPRFRGFKNNFAVEYEIVNLSQLNQFEAGTVVTPELLLEKRLVRKLSLERNEAGEVTKVVGKVKVLGEGELDRALTVKAHKFSKSAQEKLAASGGAAEVIE
jgi:large subunit ribosomal protein L15